jgi:8-oxo-dGTP diphosphatase
MIQVSAAVLRRGGKVLVCRRTRPAYLAGKWEFPGGKIEAGESPEACLVRELAEELGIEGVVGRQVARVVHHYEALSLELIAFEVEWTGGELRLLAEHDAARWVEVEELADLDLAAADLPIAAALAGPG